MTPSLTKSALITLFFIIPHGTFASVGGPFLINVLGIEKMRPVIVLVDGWRDGSGYASTLRKYDIQKNQLSSALSIDFDRITPDPALEKERKKLLPANGVSLNTLGITTNITSLDQSTLPEEKDFKPHGLLQVTFMNSNKAPMANATLRDYRESGDPIFTGFAFPKYDITLIKISYVGVPYETGYIMERLLFFKSGKLVLEHFANPSSLFREKHPN